MTQPLPFHPFLFVLSILLFFCAYNLGRMTLAENLAPMAAILAPVLVLQLAVFWMKKARKAAAVLSLFFVMFCCYGQVFDVLPSVGGSGVRHAVLLLVWAVLFWAGVRTVVRLEGDLTNLTRALNLVSVALVLMPAAQIAWYGMRGGLVWKWSRPTENPVPVSSKEAKLPRPDIYYIIVDRYAGAKTLRQSYDHDNEGFLNFLREKGFYVATESHSNYLKTPTSLASSLNFEFLHSFTSDPGRQSADWAPAYSRIRDYRAWRFLKARGYKFVHLGTRWEPTRRNPNADVSLNFYTPPEMVWALAQQTALHPFALLLDIAPLDQRLLEARRVPHQFERLVEIPADPAPTFTFAHFLVPHRPYIFESDGTVISEDTAESRTRKENYRNHVRFINGKLRDAITQLLAASPNPPVILLQSDEGPFPIRYPVEAVKFNWKEATADDLREKTGILNAYYLPGVSYDQLYPSISPVNSFRLVFNLYFHAGLPLLPDEHYAHSDDNHPYDFYPITNVIRSTQAKKN